MKRFRMVPLTVCFSGILVCFPVQGLFAETIGFAWPKNNLLIPDTATPRFAPVVPFRVYPLLHKTDTGHIPLSDAMDCSKRVGLLPVRDRTGNPTLDTDASAKQKTRLGTPNSSSVVPQHIYGLRFSPDSNYTLSVDSLQPFTNQYTLGAWFWISGPSNPDGRLITVADSGCTNEVSLLVNTPGTRTTPYTLSMFVSTWFNFTLFGINTTNVISTNAWHYAETSYDGATTRLFLDGHLIGSAGTNTPKCVLPYNFPVTHFLVSVGSALCQQERQYISPPVEVFNGIISQARITSVAEHTSDYRTNACLDNTNGILACWKFTEGSGTNASDSSGNGHTLNLLGSPPPLWTNGLGCQSVTSEVSSIRGIRDGH